MIGSIAQDVRYPLKQLARAPGFTTSAILTLALGIGANTGIFSLLNGVLRPLPVPHAEQIVVVAAELPSDDTGFGFPFSYPAVVDYRTQTGDVFSDVFAFETRIGGLTANGRTTQFVYHAVTGNFFAGLQLTPAYGRLFVPGEGEFTGGEPIVVLGHAYWRTRFGGDPGVIGSSVRIDGRTARIIGVTPPDFHGLHHGVEIEGYLTLGSLSGRAAEAGALFTDRTIRILTMLARLRPGISMPTAQMAVDVVARRLHAEYPSKEKTAAARVIPEPMARPIPLRFLTERLPLIRASTLALAALVLLIACMNVANLLLVRATVRQREMAVRAALGSGRTRLIRLLLTESLILACAGTVAGLVLARWATDLFLRSIDLPVEVPLALEFDYDWRVFTYATVLAAATGVLMGVVPALRASRGHVTALLHDGGHGGSAGAGRQRLRSALVIAQVAGSLVLLIVAGLFVRSLQRAQWVDLGFDPDYLLTVRLDPRQVGYGPARNTEFYDELDRRLRALPGVESVAMAFSVPLGYIFDGCVLVPDGKALEEHDPHDVVGCNSVTPSYFDTMRIPLASGRSFSEQDTATSAPVVIVNETMARRLWPDEDPIGKRLTFARFDGGPWAVVGVARNSKYLAVFESPLPHVYLPMTQSPSYMRVVHVRSTIPPATLGPRLQREIQALDPEVPIADLKTMRQMLAGGISFLLFRWGVIQAGAMGLLGLLLAVVGVYGVVSYGASQRAREMGIRLALGAKPGTVGRLVLRQGTGLVIAGIVSGLAVAAAVIPVIAKIFFLGSAVDVPTFLAVTGLLSAIALVACSLPARRAMRVDPMVALRHE